MTVAVAAALTLHHQIHRPLAATAKVTVMTLAGVAEAGTGVGVGVVHYPGAALGLLGVTAGMAPETGSTGILLSCFVNIRSNWCVKA